MSWIQHKLNEEDIRELLQNLGEKLVFPKSDINTAQMAEDINEAVQGYHIMSWYTEYAPTEIQIKKKIDAIYQKTTKLIKELKIDLEYGSTFSGNDALDPFLSYHATQLGYIDPDNPESPLQKIAKSLIALEKISSATKDQFEANGFNARHTFGVSAMDALIGLALPYVYEKHFEQAWGYTMDYNDGTALETAPVAFTQLILKKAGLGSKSYSAIVQAYKRHKQKSEK